MATLELIPQSQSFVQGQPISIVLRADFGPAILGSAVVQLMIPGTGFESVDVVPLAFTGPDDVFDSPPAASPLAVRDVYCSRESGAAGPTDMLRIDGTITGDRAVPYYVRAELIDAWDVNGDPLPLLFTELEITVEAGSLEIVTAALESGFAGIAYRDVLWAQGGKPPYTWSIASGALPAGIALNPDGSFSGVAANPAVAALGIRVTDQDGQTASTPLDLVIRHAPLQITVTELPAAAPGRQYSHVLTASGGKPPIQWVVDGLPPGMSVLGDRLRGRPDEHRDLFGVVPLTLRATDAESVPQTATKDVNLVFLPALPRQEFSVASPGAIVVARDLCWIDYQVTADASAIRPELTTDIADELDRARDELIASIAEVAAETLETHDPSVRRTHHESLVGLIDRYRDLDAHKRTGHGVAVELRVLVDGQEIAIVNSGGQRTIHEFRATAGRPLLPYDEPRSRRGREIRAAFAKGGRWLRAWARGVLDAAFDDYATGGHRMTGGARPRFLSGAGLGGFGTPGMGSIFEGLTSVIPSLEDFGAYFGRWFEDLFPKPGVVRLTPGNHRVTVRWDGARITIGQLITSVHTRSETIRFSVTFQPLNTPDGPRFASPTMLHGSRLGMPGTVNFDASLSSSGSDIVAASNDGLLLFTDTGKEHQRYTPAIPYPVQPGFTPERISAPVLDPFGRTSLLLHSGSDAAFILNQGPAGPQMLAPQLNFAPRERVFAASAGPRDNAGWRTVQMSFGSRLASFGGLSAVRETGVLAPPTFLPLPSHITFDPASCLALLTMGEDDPEHVAAGFDAGGQVSILGEGSLVAPDIYGQPVDLLAGNLTGGGSEVAAALRQAKRLLLFRWQSGAWQPLPSIDLPLRPWELSRGPLASGCLALASRRFGSVLLLVWSDSEYAPKLLHVRSGSAGVRIGGSDGTLAVSDPAAGKVVVYL